MKKITVFIFLIFLLSSCGGVKNTGKVKSYSPGLVTTQKSSYQVGVLSADWVQDKVGPYKALVLYNSKEKSSIETESFCDASFSDSGLSSLTTHLHFDLKDKKVIFQKEIQVDGRAALRTVVEAKVDGVPVTLDSVVIKKDSCLFDFVLISNPSHYNNVKNDFEKFFTDFHFEGLTP